MNEITYSELSEQDKPLLLEAISDVLQETDAHDLESSKESSWNWQYQDLPCGKSYVYVAKSQNRIVGYYHIPCYKIKIDNKNFKIGHIQSVAILKAYRGQGIFQKLATFANEDVNKYLDIIYTFPNNKSIHTFTKYNKFSLIKSLPVYILPINVHKIITSRYRFLNPLKIFWSMFDGLFKILSKNLTGSEYIEKFDAIYPEIENLFSRFKDRNKITLIRDKNYLNWRYLNSPKGKHRIYGLTDKGVIKAVVIVKTEELFSTKGLIVMDFAYQTSKDLQKLLTNLMPHISKEKEDSESFIFISGINEGINRLKYCGFIPIPQQFVPRKLNLLARRTGQDINEDITKSASWLITIGDWDVF